MRILKLHAAERGKKVEALDIKDEVGSAAGDLYKFLEGKGEIPLKAARVALDTRGPLFAAGIGWLLREDKLDMRVTQSGIVVKVK